MRWNLKQTQPARVQVLAEQISSLGFFQKSPAVSRILAKLLLLRGIDSPASAVPFLSPSLDSLHSPYLMTGMRAAIDRLDSAIERREGILVYGDYDVDGTTAVVILKTAIELCGGAADFHVPHRMREGYDLRGDVIERAAAAGTDCRMRWRWLILISRAVIIPASLYVGQASHSRSPKLSCRRGLRIATSRSYCSRF